MIGDEYYVLVHLGTIGLCGTASVMCLSSRSYAFLWGLSYALLQGLYMPLFEVFICLSLRSLYASL